MPKLAAVPKMLRLSAFLALSHINICKLTQCGVLIFKCMLQVLIWFGYIVIHIVRLLEFVYI